MSNKIDSATPTEAQWYKREIERLQKHLIELLADMKEAQAHYFADMHYNARVSISVYQGRATKQDYIKAYKLLCDRYKKLWSLVVQYEATLQELDKIKNERYHYYVKLREQSDKDNASD